jgi:SWI/SNF-related matrix-associated actin-dependent regulator 1 of chromatin subfamily A
MADDQGLGKTIQVAGLINNLRSRPLGTSGLYRMLVICPATLKQNWANELQKWVLSALQIDIVQGGKHIFREPVGPTHYQLLEVTIVNYEICDKLKEKIGDDYDLVVIDEVHYLKNSASKRTKAILGEGGIARKAPRVVAMSGTPMSNRPIELYSLVSTIFAKYWPKDLLGYREFGEYFCAGYDENVRRQVRGGVRWVKEFNVRGVSNLPVLNALLRERFMIRREKKDVLKQLPPKITSVVDICSSQMQNKAVRELLKTEGVYREEVVEAIETGQRLPPLEGMASVRAELGLEKVPYALEFIENMLESEEKVIVFCVHKEVVKLIRTALIEYGVSVITGATPTNVRQQRVDDFQTGPNRVFLGNIQAAGTGLTLTSASNVIFVESSWVPGENMQAEDRAHRISQLKQVWIHYLVWYGSLDAQIIRTAIRKQKNINVVMK